MRAIGAGLLWLASVTGAAAYFPVDIEHHARWVVLDDMPLRASGEPIRPEVTDLRTNDFATRPTLMSAVCGTLDFHNTDDGVTHFMVLYSVDDDGKAAMVARPFLYGRVSGRNFDVRYEGALRLCGEAAQGSVVAGAGAPPTAVVHEAAVVAETEAAANAARP